MSRDQAILRVLELLRSRMALLSIPMREEAFRLAREFNIMAEDLLNTARERALNA